MIPFLATEKMQALLAMGNKGVNFLNKCYDQLDYFMQTSWYMDASELCKFSDTLNPQTREMFPCDARNINWDQTIEGFVLGLQKFMCDQDDPILAQGYKQIVR